MIKSINIPTEAFLKTTWVRICINQNDLTEDQRANIIIQSMWVSPNPLYCTINLELQQHGRFDAYLIKSVEYFRGYILDKEATQLYANLVLLQVPFDQIKEAIWQQHLTQQGINND